MAFVPTGNGHWIVGSDGRTFTTMGYGAEFPGFKAMIATECSMLIAIWQVVQTGTFHNDPGKDYYTKHDSDPAKKRALGQSQNLGHTVTHEPII